MTIYLTKVTNLIFLTIFFENSVSSLIFSVKRERKHALILITFSFCFHFFIAGLHGMEYWSNEAWKQLVDG